MNPLLEAVPARMRPLVSPRVGVICRLDETLAGTDEPPLFRVSTVPATADELIGCSLDHVVSANGTGRSRREAVAAAIGESVERYSASYLPYERFVVATADELSGIAVHPGSFGLFSAEQYARPRFPFVPFGSETRLRWVDGVDLASGQPAWLPVELVFLADAVRTGESRIGYATSSGLACATSEIEATERGLLELLERDAFMLVWANRLSPPLLDWRDDPRLVELADRYFEPTGLEYRAVDLSSFHGLPIVLGVVLAPGSGAALGVGAAAAPTLEQAWFKALAEAFATRSAARKLALVEPERTFAADATDVLTLEDHIRFYADDAHAAAAEFLTSGSLHRSSEVPSLDASSAEERVEELVERIAAAGSGAYAVDVTAPDVRETGLRVIKTVAPGLCALDVPHVARFQGATRLLHLSTKDTLTRPGRFLDDLNPWPHPFP
ncbi:MAG: YcaO-like family protein [Actinobacteria bacterium]|nr:YcaO-like family protein [Actinomycetota bacterium]